MKREEEIKYASKDYVNYLLDKQEYHNENYTEYDIQQAFEKGAKWADKHPINLWHKVDEEPSKDTYILMETSFFKDNLEYYSHYWSAASAPSWEEYVKDWYIKRWIYLYDLLR